ncbi:hypothetical protein F5051DRAFT_439807 [Lentinula edodes]|nr:hypothetical protein F5051DRAFT_439807 [Lentinula edodes]
MSILKPNPPGTYPPGRIPSRELTTSRPISIYNLFKSYIDILPSTTPTTQYYKVPSFLSSVAVPVAPFELQPAPSTLQHKPSYTKPYLKTYSDPGLTTALLPTSQENTVYLHSILLMETESTNSLRPLISPPNPSFKPTLTHGPNCPSFITIWNQRRKRNQDKSPEVIISDDEDNVDEDAGQAACSNLSSASSNLSSLQDINFELPSKTPLS